MPQGYGLRQDVFVQEQFFMARARPVDVKRREDTLLLKPPVKNQFHIAGAFKLFVNKVIHTAPRVYKGCSYNGHASAFLTISCSS